MTKKKNPADLKKRVAKVAVVTDTVKATVSKTAALVVTKATKATATFSPSKPKPSPALAKKQAGFRLDLLDNWMGLNTEVKDMSEAECNALIEHERAARCRPNVILRLHGRMNKLRGMREKSEFMRPINKK